MQILRIGKRRGLLDGGVEVALTPTRTPGRPPARTSLVYLPTNISLEAEAKQRYVTGKCELEEFEADIWLILNGGTPEWLFGGLTPFRRPAMEAVPR